VRDTKHQNKFAQVNLFILQANVYLEPVNYLRGKRRNRRFGQTNKRIKSSRWLGV